MARIKVPFKGVTSQSNHADGECKNIVNLRPERGYYKPVTPRKNIQTMPEYYDIVFVHRVNDYENWIGIKYDYVEGVRSIVSYNANAVSPSVPLPLADIGERVNSVQQIGHVLIFVTSFNIYYAIFKPDLPENKYKYLGTLPALKPITITAGNTYEVKRSWKNEYGDGLPKEIESLTVQIKGLFNKCADIIKNGGSNMDGSVFNKAGYVLYDAHIIRYAYRLYDGSLIKHSSPILLMPDDILLHFKKIKLDILNSKQFNTANSYVTLKGFNVKLSINTDDLTEYKDIIKSIDIFISQPMGFTNIENLGRADSELLIRDTYLRLIEAWQDGSYMIDDVPVFDEILPSAIENVKNDGKFYLIDSIEIGENKSNYLFPTSQTNVLDSSNIVYQELMPIDSLSHHTYGSTSASIYNNRLRLSQVGTKLFYGFRPDLLTCWDSYYGYTAPTDYLSHVMKVLIKTNYGIEEVRTEFNGSVFLNPIISYPDPRAYKLSIYLKRSRPEPPYNFLQLVFEANLNPHPSLNIAYAVHDEVQPFYADRPHSTLIPDIGYLNNNIQIEYNKIKVSEVNNPFVFPNANTYQVGSGEILAESSIIMNVSDRNYGMYPVFVFTTDGVFTMSGQDAGTVHASIQAPTYLEPPISNVICATPYGVVFITKRGLMQISNRSTEFLSQVLREDDEVLEIDLTGVEDDMLTYPTMSFREDLKSIRNIVYSPYDDELIISVDAPYNYVYDYETRSFYLSTNLIGQLVQNSFPDVYYITDNKLIDISQQESKATQVSVLTRPIQFETADIKKLDRIFLRGLIYNANNMSVAAYHSIDGVNYSPIKGFKFGSGANYKDYDLGMLARETYRQYIFLLTGTIDEESQLEYVEFEVDKNYNNDKMR